MGILIALVSVASDMCDIGDEALEVRKVGGIIHVLEGRRAGNAFKLRRVHSRAHTNHKNFCPGVFNVVSNCYWVGAYVVLPIRH